MGYFWFGSQAHLVLLRFRFNAYIHYSKDRNDMKLKHLFFPLLQIRTNGICGGSRGPSVHLLFSHCVLLGPLHILRPFSSSQGTEHSYQQQVAEFPFSNTGKTKHKGAFLLSSETAFKECSLLSSMASATGVWLQSLHALLLERHCFWEVWRKKLFFFPKVTSIFSRTRNPAQWVYLPLWLLHSCTERENLPCSQNTVLEKKNVANLLALLAEKGSVPFRSQAISNKVSRIRCKIALHSSPVESR